MQRASVAGVHIEDQVMQKRCGHRPNKAIVSQAEMVDHVKAAVDARSDDDFVIMARPPKELLTKNPLMNKNYY